MKINTPISVGELVDKLTILEIKSKMIQDQDKLKEVSKEELKLSTKFADLVNSTLAYNFSKKELLDLKEELYKINLNLWKIEDYIRELERNKIFDEEFISTARSVYYTNDQRFDIKNKINQLTNSDIREIKSYESYS